MQDEDRLIEVLSHRILTSLDRGQHMDETTFRHLFSLVAQMTDPQAGRKNPSLADLEQDVAARYTYQDVSDSDGFDLGACWGALEVYRELLLTDKKREERDVRAWAVRKHYEMVRLVEREPGITQGSLAKRLGQKRSNFSQMIARLDKYQIFTFSLVGKAKHLYLTRAGKEALETVEEELRREKARGNSNDMSLANATVYRAFIEQREYNASGALSNCSHRYMARVVKGAHDPKPILDPNMETVTIHSADTTWKLGGTYETAGELSTRNDRFYSRYPIRN